MYLCLDIKTPPSASESSPRCAKSTFHVAKFSRAACAHKHFLFVSENYLTRLFLSDIAVQSADSGAVPGTQCQS